MLRSNKKLGWLLAVAVAMALLPASGQALLVERPMTELVKQSDLILQGQVVSMESHWGLRDQDKATIFTDVTLLPYEYIKGTTDQPEVKVEIMGGEVGEIGLLVEDMPRFRPGEETILLLSPPNEQGLRLVTNLYQGKYSVRDGLILETGEPATWFASRVRQVVQDQESRER